MQKKGHELLLQDVQRKKLEETKLEIEQFPGQVLPVPMDVRNTDDIPKMIEQIDEKLGRLDVS
ncbi:2,4-dienoyl-CoA reductase (NADPH) [Bacillus thuringiensis serovar israelensis ATCC 35646]|nr:2,4-dienoyl-CoA reductase (NADPH) [Bacillus thuringiensis serovar israelensis ATCC 35646]